eukprot:scaffold2599_cov125-Cylindrotheca_fusiformis.AAC.9
MAASSTLEAAQHLCQEARVVLTSLRGGPPNVARGDLAQDLMDVRARIKKQLLTTTTTTETETPTPTTTTTSPNLPTNPSRQAPTASPMEEDEDDDTVLVQSPTRKTALPSLVDVGFCARPFLAVVMDPRAAGPHTLVALRSLHRLLERSSLVPTGDARHSFHVGLEPLTKGVLNCRFEQTDAGADEAVEMAIADLLALLVRIDRRAIRPETLMDAFNTVFVTRNTFVHSPALCYHFEDVLTTMLKVVFGDLDMLRDRAAKLILEFLVNQLLHTPFVGGDDEASREAQMAHDATRVLCLRLTRAALRTGFKNVDHETYLEAMARFEKSNNDEDRSLLHIIQDDLCLSLLMTGQAIWAYEDNTSIRPGFISLEVLSEICSTLATLWTSVDLRKHLVSQFESIFTGFFQRSLVLLRQRRIPTDSLTFHANLIFDAATEIILESLVDIMSLHDHQHTVAQGNGGSLETLFATYDCNMKRSDAAVGLMIELCRCCGSKVDEDGDIILDCPLSETGTSDDSPPTPVEEASDPSSGEAELSPADVLRQVPPHLKELCAESIIGGMRCLFRDDHPSEKTKMERRGRDTIMEGKLPPAPQSLSDLSRAQSAHLLRSIKSKKRLMRRAAHLFNQKSSKGIEFLVNSGVIADPVTPRSVASFLRNGIVVGLDKKAVGAYLGEVGKSPVAGKSPPNWERDWFHKEVLETYCSLFGFENQTLLDGLRMFLACFRLPGEAQQIDRILQSFSDCCSRLCEEGVQGIFSDDPKRASDAAYLLSFSIIMLNTDQHNDNIREDRKMTKQDFFRNNSDYGRDITEPGKEFSPEYLGAIYDSIREEEIRTEGEGADGSMTVERWKDVLRGSMEDEAECDKLPTTHDAEDLTELVLEHVWMPIMSAIGALWGVKPAGVNQDASADAGSSGMLGAQGARLGMDMAYDMLVGVRNLGRNDIFNKIFNSVCMYSGLLTYTSNAAERAWALANSVESQGAFILALRTARDTIDDVGVDGFKKIWSMVFELRDLKMLGGGTSNKRTSILMESDPDLLKEHARRDLNMKMIKRGQSGDQEMEKKSSGLWNALFGNVEDPPMDEVVDAGQSFEVKSTVHGKEDHVIWDELAPSDDEDEEDEIDNNLAVSVSPDGGELSLGTQFESHLIQENMMLTKQHEMPVTGLERVDDAQVFGISPRARVRKRLMKSCDFVGLVSDSRFMDDEGLCHLLEALISLIPAISTEEKVFGDFPISPASEAFAEVLICEIALRNRDRLTMLWDSLLQAHYKARLESIAQIYTESQEDLLPKMNGCVEKAITGLLRISCCSVQKGHVPNEVLSTWTILDSIKEEGKRVCLMNSLDLHLGEGLWRITRCIDDATKLQENGWMGLFSLSYWCANRGCMLPPIRSSGIGRPVGLPEDDPALQAYRSLHFLLNASEVKENVPPLAIRTIRCLIAAGNNRNCPKLSIAGLDLLHVLNNQTEAAMAKAEEKHELSAEAKEDFWYSVWGPVLEGMTEAIGLSAYTVSILPFYLHQILYSHLTAICYVLQSVRQHALSMLTDSFLDKQGGFIPTPHLCDALGKLCIPLAGRGIVELREGRIKVEDFDELVIELELCIGLIFKPLRHHLKNVVKEDETVILSLWTPILDVLKEVLKEPAVEESSDEAFLQKALHSTNELTVEHLRNVITVLIGYGVLKAEPESPNDITDVTWEAVGSMDPCKNFLDEWKQVANNA